MTITGKTIEENLKHVRVDYDKQKIVYSTKNPISATGGVGLLEILHRMAQ